MALLRLEPRPTRFACEHPPGSCAALRLFSLAASESEWVLTGHVARQLTTSIQMASQVACGGIAGQQAAAAANPDRVSAAAGSLDVA